MMHGTAGFPHLLLLVLVGFVWILALVAATALLFFVIRFAVLSALKAHTRWQRAGEPAPATPWNTPSAPAGTPTATVPVVSPVVSPAVAAAEPAAPNAQEVAPADPALPGAPATKPRSPRTPKAP